MKQNQIANFKFQRLKSIINIILLVCIFNILFLIFNFNTAEAAITPTPPSKTISPTISETLNQKLNSQINQLKDKIASRVSELNLVEKKGITGDVTEISTNKITLTDISGSKVQIDIDEITKFSSVSAKGTFGLSDLTKGTKINVLGLFNKQSKRILARFITTAVNPIFLTGTIYSIDSKNFTVDIVSTDKKNTKLDIVGAATKITAYNKIDGLTRTVFAKLSVGDRLAVVGYPDKKDPTLLVASRIVDLQDIPKDPNVSITLPSPTAVPTAVLRRTAPLQITTPSTIKISPTISR